MPKPKFHIVVCTNARPPGHPSPHAAPPGLPESSWHSTWADGARLYAGTGTDHQFELPGPL